MPVDTGFLHALIANLTAEVQKLKRTVDEDHKEIKKLKTDVADLQAKQSH